MWSGRGKLTLQTTSAISGVRVAKAAKAFCIHCGNRVREGEPFCGTCGRPTSWASHDDRVAWELAQWSHTSGRGGVHAPAPPQPRRRAHASTEESRGTVVQMPARGGYVEEVYTPPREYFARPGRRTPEPEELEEVEELVRKTAPVRPVAQARAVGETRRPTALPPRRITRSESDAAGSPQPERTLRAAPEPQRPAASLPAPAAPAAVPEPAAAIKAEAIPAPEAVAEEPPARAREIPEHVPEEAEEIAAVLRKLEARVGSLHERVADLEGRLARAASLGERLEQVAAEGPAALPPVPPQPFIAPQPVVASRPAVAPQAAATPAEAVPSSGPKPGRKVRAAVAAFRRALSRIIEIRD